MHVLKGAMEKTIGPRRLISAKLEGTRGSLNIASDRPLSPQDVAKIEAAANRKVAEDAEFLEFEMERQEAEGHFGKGIYDLSPAPVKGLLRITRIPEWDVGYCRESHVTSTAPIGAIKIDGAAFNQGRKELLLRFHVE